MDAFAYIASHDLRAPLRDIDNLAQWISEDAEGVLSEDSLGHLRTLQSRIHRMEGLLADLLEYSRAGRTFDEPEAIDLRSLFEDVLELIGEHEGFTIVLPDAAPSIRTPRAPLAQVFRNLVGNAIKHHDRPTGRVVVVARERDDSFVEFEVADDGPGIPPELHQRAFTMFQTLRPRDEVEGTGMGLALVRRMVEAHGGTIQLDSREGEGARFRFTWPRVWTRG